MKFKDFETLKKNKDFQKVYKEKKIFANRHIIMYVRKNEDENLRLGVSVSKKVGNSVVRHRLTRLIREAFRLNSSYMKRGFDIVAVVREDLKGKGYKGADGKDLVIDGEYGDNTAHAVEQLQKAAGMKNIFYGTVANLTWSKLIN